MKLRVQITKERGIRFISHLEYQKTLEKAIRRARIPVAYSQGFNPHMRFSLASALGVGVTSQCEFMELKLREERPLKELVDALAANLPMGIHVVAADLCDDKAHSKAKGSPRTIPVKEFISDLSWHWDGRDLGLDFDCRITPTGSMKAREFLEVLAEQFGLPLSIDAADIARTALYARDAAGRKVPLLQAARA